MKFRQIAILPILMVLVTSCSMMGSGPDTPKDPVSSMYQLQQQLHQQVRDAMQQSAERMNISIQLETFVFASRDDFVAASALVSSFDNLVYEDQTNRVVDLGLVYLNLPANANIPIGFFKVRAFILQSRAELLDASGQPVITLPLERLGYIEGSSKPMMIVSGCDVTVPYNQIKQAPNVQTVQVAVRFSWCDRLVR